MVERNQTNPDKLKSMLAYLPLVNVYLFFTEDNQKSKELFIHIKYSLMIFGIYIITSMVVSIFLPFLSFFVFLAYFGIIGFIIYKINAGEDIDFKVLDNLEKNVKSKLK